MKKRIYFYVMMFVLLGGAVTSSRAESFKVTLPKVTGTTIAPVGLYNPDRVNKGDAFKFTIVIEGEGSVLVKAGDEVLTTCAKDTYVIYPIVADIVVTVVADLDSYNVTLPMGTGYVASGAKDVFDGANYELTIKLTEHYKDCNTNYKVTATNCEKIEKRQVSNVENVWTLVNVMGNPEITVSDVVKNNYVVSWTDPVGVKISVKNGEIDIANGAYVDYGTVLTIKGMADPGYRTSAILINETRTNLVGGANTVTHTLTTAAAIAAEAKEEIYTVSIKDHVGAILEVFNGTELIPPTSNHKYGVELRITAKVRSGYTLGKITVNGIEVKDDKYTVVGATIIKVEANPIPCTVTIEPSENGIISLLKEDNSIVKNGDVIDYGTELTIRATPETNYKLANVKVNGAVITNQTIIVKKSITISATFEEIKQCVITIGSVENGTIVVMNELEIVKSGTAVENGTELSIRATPATDYVLTDITVDGEPINGKTIVVKKSITIGAIFNLPDGVESVDDSQFTIHADGRNVYVRGDEVADVLIYDINGRIVKQMSMCDLQCMIAVENTGIYIVKVVLDSRVVKTGKIIVK